MSLNEFIVEDAALEWFGELGYYILPSCPSPRTTTRVTGFSFHSCSFVSIRGSTELIPIHPILTP